jgi:phosphoribosylanthranilate isomerase
MRRARVKICGITREEDLANAVAAGADAIGFVVGATSSPRNLTLKEAEKLIKQVPIFVDSVAVTVANSIDLLSKIYGKLRPDALQIHGENLHEVSSIRQKITDAHLIRAVYRKTGNVIEAAVEVASAFDAIHLDSFVYGKYGGTGIVHDWDLSGRVRQAIYPKPLILAGGLNPENVKDAIRAVQPYAVDVSTGVESLPGIKDPEKVSAFIQNAKEARIYDNQAISS